MAIELPSTDAGMNKERPRATDPPAGAKGETGLQRYNRERKENKEKRDRDSEMVREAVKRFKRCVEAEADNRAAALEDLKFKAGKQWPSDVESQRSIDKRPCLTINGLPTFTHQIANDIRQNRPAINVSPLGSESTKESAELYASFIRAIERDCAADIAYDTAVGSAIDVGFGYWRFLTEYESPTTFNQVIVVKRVRNAFTVYLDPNRQEPDGSDAAYGFVSELLDRSEFREKYPKANEVSWKERGIGDDMKEWVTKDQIRVAEYFTIEHETRRLVQLETGHVGWYDELAEDVKAKIASGALKVMNDRESESAKVKWYRLTCQEVLEEIDWPGKWIPIVEVIGDEIDLEGKVIRSGVIRNAKDPMRMKNYWATAKTEVVALAPKAPYILAEGQDEGYEDEWKQANNKPLPVLHYVPVKGEGGMPVPPPARQPPPPVPSGIVEAEKSSEQDLMRTTGVRFDASLSERMYDESGKAIRELRRSGDIGSFHFSDNFGRSLRHGGRIFLDLIPKVYDSERFVAVVAEDGTDSRIKIDPSQARPVGRIPNPMPPAPGQKPGSLEPVRVFNPKKGEHGVTITTGPSYATKRIEAQEQMSQFIGKVPEPMRGVVAALMAKYSDWPGSTELFKALVKMLPPGVLMPDQKDLPPAVAAFLGGLQKQIQQLMTERMQLLRELTDKKIDQGLARDKINKDFEAKLLAIAQKAQSQMDRLDLHSIDATAEGARRIEEMLMQGASAPGGFPPVAPVAPGGNGAPSPLS